MTMAPASVVLTCRICGRSRSFRPGTQYAGKPIEDWFRDDRDSLCADHYPGEAVARLSDPQTSWDAARSISTEALRESQLAVLKVLRQVGPSTLEELVAEYEHRAQLGYVPKQSDSGIRTRCKELTDRGVVIPTGQTRKGRRSNRQARVLAAAP